MKKVLGIVAEFNPLHNGHVFLVEQAKQLVKPDYTVVVMSGNFTQRGEPSLINKWEKAKISLQAGIDMVIELPTIYSISSAENFANGAIKILNQVGVTHIAFGTEEKDISELSYISDILYNEPKELSKIIKEKLQEGISYPKARQEALRTYLKSDKYSSLLTKPNNILAVEYLKAIKRQNFNINSIGIKRKAVMHDSKKIIDNYSSGTFIRNLIKEKKWIMIKKLLPCYSFNILKNNIDIGNYFFDLSILEKTIIYKIRCMTIEEIADIAEVTEGLEFLIQKTARQTNNLSIFIDKIKSKRYTTTKIHRIILYILLGITKQDMRISKDIIPYIRILGMNNKGKNILRTICKDTICITSLKNYEICNKNIDYQRLLNIDKLATDIYTLGYINNSKANLDYTKRIIIT